MYIVRLGGHVEDFVSSDEMLAGWKSRRTKCHGYFCRATSLIEHCFLVWSAACQEYKSRYGKNFTHPE